MQYFCTCAVQHACFFCYATCRSARTLLPPEEFNLRLSCFQNCDPVPFFVFRRRHDNRHNDTKKNVSDDRETFFEPNGAVSSTGIRCFSSSAQRSQRYWRSPPIGTPIRPENCVTPRLPILKISCFGETLRLFYTSEVASVMEQAFLSGCLASSKMFCSYGKLHFVFGAHV